MPQQQLQDQVLVSVQQLVHRLARRGRRRKVHATATLRQLLLRHPTGLLLRRHPSPKVANLWGPPQQQRVQQLQLKAARPQRKLPLQLLQQLQLAPPAVCPGLHSEPPEVLMEQVQGLAQVRRAV